MYEQILDFCRSHGLYILDEGSLSIGDNPFDSSRLYSLCVKPHTYEEFDAFTTFLDEHDIEYEHTLDIRTRFDIEQEDIDAWNNLFDVNCPDEYIEILGTDD